MTLALGLDVARSGLAVTSDQIATVSRNVARAGEADATRKIVQVVTGPGSGVRPAGWVRSADSALLDKVLAAASATGAQEEIARALGELSSATVGDPELERSPAALIARLEGALHQYATAPQDVARARLAVAAASDLAQGLNDATRAVTAIRQRADEAMAASVASLNDLLGKFELLNREVVGGTRRGADVTDALDARDGLLKQIAVEIGVRTVARADGDLAIYTDSGVTLFETRPRPVTFAPSPSLMPGATGAEVYIDGVPVVGTPVAMPAATGRLPGLVAVRDEITVTYQAQLDEIARGLIESFAEHDQSATPTRPPVTGLFTYPGAPALPPTGTVSAGLAGTITVHPNVDPARGGDANRLRDGGISGNPAYVYNTTGAAGFAERLQGVIAELAAVRAFDPAAQAEPAASLARLASSSVSWLEGARHSSSAAVEYQRAVRDRATEALSRDTGVNIDEEMARMLSLERAYQASSRLITVIDDMLGALLAAAA
jgi:flagellar hook-associated protein 1 FlgK